jgi:hypothetical protein
MMRPAPDQRCSGLYPSPALGVLLRQAGVAIRGLPSTARNQTFSGCLRTPIRLRRMNGLGRAASPVRCRTAVQ